jgi:hypothetical protein
MSSSKVFFRPQDAVSGRGPFPLLCYDTGRLSRMSPRRLLQQGEELLSELQCELHTHTATLSTARIRAAVN